MRAKTGWLLLSAAAGLAVMPPPFARSSAAMPIFGERGGSGGGRPERDPSKPINEKIHISEPRPRERSSNNTEASAEARSARYDVAANAHMRGAPVLAAAEGVAATSKAAFDAARIERTAGQRTVDAAIKNQRADPTNPKRNAELDAARAENVKSEADYQAAKADWVPKEAKAQKLRELQKLAMDAVKAQAEGSYVPPRAAQPRFQSTRPAKFIQPVAAVAKAPRQALKPAREKLNEPSHYSNVDWQQARRLENSGEHYSDINSIEADFRKQDFSDPDNLAMPEYADANFMGMNTLMAGLGGVRQNGAGGAAPLNVDAVSASVNQDQGAVPSRTNQPRVMFALPRAPQGQ